jgi:hypothetical protein
MEAVRKIDRKIKKVLAMYKMHHPNADADMGEGKEEEEACYKLK